MKILGLFLGLNRFYDRTWWQKAYSSCRVFVPFYSNSKLDGQLPLKLIHLKHGGELASPTNDINLTAALAVIVLIYYVVADLQRKN